MKKAGLIAGVVLVGFGLAIAANWDEGKRLMAVNTLFDADRIVSNFSNMDELMLTRDMDAGVIPEMPVALRDLPQTVEIAGSPRDLEALLNETDTTSLLVLHDGVIVHESYRLGTSAEDQRVSWSVAKSFLSALVGRAVADGDIASLDDDVTAYVPELRGTAYEGASVRNVLNMASGVRFNEDYFDKDSDINRMGRALALGGSLDDFSEELVEREFAPGAFNQYVSIDTHVIGRVLRAATGRTVYELFEEAFAPVGLGPVSYLTDGEGEAFVLGGLLLTTRGYARFGQLFAQGGEWEDETIIPADWVAESTVISAPPVYGTDTRGRAYGYQWWMLPGSEGDYFANGIYGQTIFVDPARSVVVVKTSADREFSGQGESGLPTQVEVVEAMRGISAWYDR